MQGVNTTLPTRPYTFGRDTNHPQPTQPNDGSVTLQQPFRVATVTKDLDARFAYWQQQRKGADKSSGEWDQNAKESFEEFTRRRLAYGYHLPPQEGGNERGNQAQATNGQLRGQQGQKKAPVDTEALANKPQSDAQFQDAPLVVREYTHLRILAGDDARRDLTDTVFWHPVLVLHDGYGQVTFDLNDAATIYQVRAMGHTLDGRIGSSTFNFEARLPFALDARMPAQISSGDRIDMPVRLTNNTEGWRAVLLQIAGRGMQLGAQRRDLYSHKLTLDPKDETRTTVSILPSVREGQASVRLSASSAAQRDTVERVLEVVPDGFPITGEKIVRMSRTLKEDIVLPEDRQADSLRFQVLVFPTPLAALLNTVEGREGSRRTGLEAELAQRLGDDVLREELTRGVTPTPEQLARLRDNLDRLKAPTERPASDPTANAKLKTVFAPPAPGPANIKQDELSVYVNGVLVGRQPFVPQQTDPVTLNLPAADAFFRTGKNEVRVELKGDAELPARLSWSYLAKQPASDPAAPVALRTSLDKLAAEEGESVRLQAEIANLTDQVQKQGVAVIGLPAGLSLSSVGRKQLQQAAQTGGKSDSNGAITHWEVRGRELLLYYADVPPKGKLNMEVDLRCDVPGIYRGPASSINPTAMPAAKYWTAPLNVQIKAK
jgi:hypothetical protein